MAPSTSSDLAISTVDTTANGCLSGGGITAELDAGTIYFVAAAVLDHRLQRPSDVPFSPCQGQPDFVNRS